MSALLKSSRRLLFAVLGVAALAAAAALLLAGFAFSGLWPGVSWAVGGALALVALVVAARSFRAAFTVRSPTKSAEQIGGRGAI
jgi:membrane protein implicated in regulation of membrane protease activity